MDQVRARETLSRGRYLLSEAQRLEPSVRHPGDRTGFDANIEAAIEMGKKVAYHLRHEFRLILPEFKQWLDEKEKDPLIAFFTGLRHVSVHQLPLKAGRVIQVRSALEVNVAMSVEAKVVRGRPLHRHSTSELWALFWNTTLARIVRRCGWAQPKHQEPRSLPPTPSLPADFFHFAKPPYHEENALELIEQYLDKLETVIAEAEREFGT